MKKLFSKISKTAEQILILVGSVLNQCPGKEELKKIRLSPVFRSKFPKMKSHFCHDPKKDEAETNSHPKGGPHFETRTFNKSRK